MRRRFERGEVPFGCLAGLVVVGITALIAIKMIPLMVNMGELDREIKILADRGNRREYTDKRIYKDILQRASALDLPVKKENVKIERSRTRIKIWVNYDLDVDFIFYTYHWKKEHYEDRPLF